MKTIFLSYRRDDTEGQAGRLYKDLVRHFGAQAVFMDVAAIAPGRDFRRAIDEHVASCGVLLALIGKRWIDAASDRSDDAHDFVRLETAAALKRDIPVIPVLVQGAKMPRAEQLHPDLRELVYRNAVELTHARWDSDVEVLIRALGVLGDASPGTSRAVKTAVPRRSLMAILGAAVAALAITVLAYNAYDTAGPTSPDTETSSTGQGTELPGQYPTNDGENKPLESDPPAPSMAGVWEGWYHCLQGPTGLHLEIAPSSAETLEGRLDFFPLPSNPTVPSGSYRVRVEHAASQTKLVGFEWLDRPTRPVVYAMVDLQGTLSVDGIRFSGRVADPNCEEFSLERTR